MQREFTPQSNSRAQALPRRGLPLAALALFGVMVAGTLFSCQVNLQSAGLRAEQDAAAQAQLQQLAGQIAADLVQDSEYRQALAAQNSGYAALRADLQQTAADIAAFDATRQCLLPVETIRQLPELPNGCEITSATIVLNYLGFSVDKLTMADQYLPKQYPYYEVDPNTAYMGNPRGSGWYCYAPPLVTAINAYLDDAGAQAYRAQDITGAEVEELKQYLQQGTPVIFWGTIGFGTPIRSVDFVLPTGEVPYTNLHCLVLRGYDESYMYIVDPLGYTNKVSLEQFTSVYTAMGSRAVVITRQEEFR